MAEKETIDHSPSDSLNDKADINHAEGRKMSAVEKAAALEAQQGLDPAMEARVTRKCDLHIIPWLFCIWSVSRRSPRSVC